ncbi:hypothetical protein NC652_027417 [Populus alba x Populus x berolinensis]|nr:hypothetical protein NC652_027417 [Populus alba x Populus x berolinensis]
MPQIPKRSRIDGSHVALTASCSKMRTIYDMAIPQLGRILKGKARQMQHSSISFAIQQEIGLAMTIAYGNHAPTPTRPGGKHKGIVVCWFLGLGSLVSWNSMLTIGDYYYCLFPKYHPSRVLTLVYQPFALGTMAILAYNEAKINTRKRNVAGYILFAASTLMLMVVDLATWRMRNWTFYWHMCNCCCFRSCRCPCSRWNGWRHGFHVS